ncbi:MAG: HAD family phosphatase [Kofleriaceae bacterium]
MRRPAAVTTLFLDIGGVVLSNGWDHHARRRAAKALAIDDAELEQRHRAAFEVFETGKLTIDEYLGLVVFHCKRSFTRARFRRFMFEQSQPHPAMLALVARLRTVHELKVVVVSNEARELNAYRIRTFGLAKLVDGFVSSCFVGIRKPDPQIFRLALDLAQAAPSQVVYIDDTEMFVEVAARLGIRSVHHVDARSTAAKLASFGLHGGDRDAG